MLRHYAASTSRRNSSSCRFRDSPLSDNWTAADNREPLATNFAVRFLNGGIFDGGTDLLVWRDSKTNQKPFTCPAANGNPAWYPLGQEGIVIFDEQEQPQVPQSFPVSPQPPQQGLIPFPAEAQRTA